MYAKGRQDFMSAFTYIFRTRAKKDASNVVAVCTEHTGKMEGMMSISTSCEMNDHCRKRAMIKGSICEKCFARKGFEMRPSMRAKYEHNTRLLTSRVLGDDELPILNNLVFRFESFGDLNNSTQVINYFNIARKNPETMFALWTKNPFYISNAIRDGHSKPANIIIIYSSPMIDTDINTERLLKAFPFIDKVFTVYRSEKKAAEHGRVINCGTRKCLVCRRCYRKDTEREISELLK